MKTSSNKTASRKDCSKRPQRNLARLGGYVATTVGAGILATPAADAAVIAIDIGPSGFNIGGVNGGVADGNFRQINDFAGAGSGYVNLFNNWNTIYGLALGAPASIANNGSYATPTRLSAGQLIDSSLTFGGDTRNQVFKFVEFSNLYLSPSFPAGSYIGFKTATNSYGYFEVTWDATSQWQILSGAYESDPNTPILAGAPPTPTAVPEIDPSGFASVASMAIGSLAMLEQRRRKRAAAATATATTA